MIVGTNGSMLRLLVWQWKFVVIAGGSATAIWAGYEHLGFKWLALPSLPLAVVGAALGIFVSFRTNSSYDRWWEGRKLWGRMINTSRHLSMEVKRYLPPEKKEAGLAMVRRHVAYVHSLRCLLRTQDPLQDDDVKRYLTDDEKTSLVGSSNLTLRLLDLQLEALVDLRAQDKIDEFRLQSFDLTLRHLLDIQGGCERIKKTPLPKIYGLISVRLIQWFGALLPCALVSEISWGCIPITIAVTLGFQMISETGRVLEDPFTMFYNGLPLSTISRMIEINVLEVMGEQDLPEPWPPKSAFVIM